MDADHLTRDEVLQYHTHQYGLAHVKLGSETCTLSDGGVISTNTPAEVPSTYVNWGGHMEIPDIVATDLERLGIVRLSAAYGYVINRVLIKAFQFQPKPCQWELNGWTAVERDAEREAEIELKPEIDHGDVVRRVRGRENTRIGKHRASKPQSWYLSSNAPTKHPDPNPGPVSQPPAKVTRGLAAMFTFTSPSRPNSTPKPLTPSQISRLTHLDLKPANLHKLTPDSPPTPIFRPLGGPGSLVAPQFLLEETAATIERKKRDSEWVGPASTGKEHEELTDADRREFMRWNEGKRRERREGKGNGKGQVKRVRFRIDEMVEMQRTGEEG